MFFGLGVPVSHLLHLLPAQTAPLRIPLGAVGRGSRSRCGLSTRRPGGVPHSHIVHWAQGVAVHRVHGAGDERRRCPRGELDVSANSREGVFFSDETTLLDGANGTRTSFPG